MAGTAGIRRGIGRAVKVLAEGVDAVRPPRRGLVILIYHRVGGASGSSVDLDQGRFDAQVAELAASGRIVSLDEGLTRLAADQLDGAPVVLSFDDGTADWVDQVLPVLVRHAAPATFYVATDFVERQVELPGGAPPVTWTGLAELCATGLATIGSHTHSHALLDRSDGPAAAIELDTSVGLIGERLGVACDHFAYPKALLGSPAAEGEVRRRFRSATIAGTRANVAGADPHRLHRSPVQQEDGMRWFRRKAAGGMWLEDAGRSLANRRRYAGATR